MNLTFSQRIGVTPIRQTVQTDSMDNDLRTGLWNVFFLLIFDGKTTTEYNLIPPNLKSFLVNMWFDFLKGPVDAIPDNYHQAHDVLRELFLKVWKWPIVYDFMEFAVRYEQRIGRDSLETAWNSILERELSGFRFVNHRVTLITDKTELSAIEDAIQQAGSLTQTGAKEHLDTALKYLSDRQNPDYRNSIKESISAIEAIARIISGNPKAKLTDVLKRLEDTLGLHPALRSAYATLYGYASDEAGIRHAMQHKSEVDFADAKYMIVICSAFVYYLIEKGRKAHLL